MADTLSGLRSLMATHSPPLDALVVPSEDYHQVHDPIPVMLLDPKCSLFSIISSNTFDLSSLT